VKHPGKASFTYGYVPGFVERRKGIGGSWP
jgi:hypothetical protein